MVRSTCSAPAKRLKVPILQASTSEVYGDPEVHPQHESHWGASIPVGPRSCYDEGKAPSRGSSFSIGQSRRS
ncbi:MAG: GDP-mannose 4,6-dehydratase [Gammaproteobacteria bacterium]|nr:GDP-mannose 4,6-dehydratase [Gammaproteobacteria bacterium]